MEDRDAIRSCLNGDRDAFRELVQRYQRKAIAHAFVLCGEFEAAKDCVQEAFLDAFRVLDRFDSDRAFYPWFYVLVRNRCLKQASRRGATVAPEMIDLKESPDGKGTTDPEVQEALLLLDAGEREILTLKYVDGLRYRELAELLGLPMGTVMSRLFNARRALRARLERLREETT